MARPKASLEPEGGLRSSAPFWQRPVLGGPLASSTVVFASSTLIGASNTAAPEE